MVEGGDKGAGAGVAIGSGGAAAVELFSRTAGEEDETC